MAFSFFIILFLRFLVCMDAFYIGLIFRRIFTEKHLRFFCDHGYFTVLNFQKGFGIASVKKKCKLSLLFMNSHSMFEEFWCFHI